MVDLTPAVTGIAIALAVCIVVLIAVLCIFFSGTKPLIEGYSRSSLMEEDISPDKYRCTGKTGFISEQEAYQLQQNRNSAAYNLPPAPAVPQARPRMYLPEVNQPFQPPMLTPPMQRMAEISTRPTQQFGWAPVGAVNNLHVADIHQTPRGTEVTIAGDDVLMHQGGAYHLGAAYQRC